MVERERRPEREQGGYDPAEDPDTDPPASGEEDAPTPGPVEDGANDERDD